MLLIINCNIKCSQIENFNKNIKASIKNSDLDYHIVNADDIEDLKDVRKYTHLIISGSLACALEDNTWDMYLTKIINYFIKEKKSILGICYGHQFIIKTVLGLNSIRTAKKPEIGLAKININKENILFNDMDDVYSFVFHYQEVYNLTDDFNILAYSDTCNVHAYQYKDLPIWGIQFHPEFDLVSAKMILDDVKSLGDISKEIFLNDLKIDEDISQNYKIFDNFLKSRNTDR